MAITLVLLIGLAVPVVMPVACVVIARHMFAAAAIVAPAVLLWIHSNNRNQR